jgi:hypothetical protein
MYLSIENELAAMKDNTVTFGYGQLPHLLSEEDSNSSHKDNLQDDELEELR